MLSEALPDPAMAMLSGAAKGAIAPAFDPEN
jgi:hypothetical protein